MSIQNEIREALVPAGPNGIHTISLTDQSQPSNLALSSAQKLICNTIIAALDNPRTYVYNLGGDRIDIPGISTLLINSKVRDEVISVMQDGIRIREIIEAISGAKYGVFATDTDSISFEIVRDRLTEILPISQAAIYVVSNFFTPFRTIMGLMAPSYVIQKMVAKKDIYPSKDSLIEELIFQQIETAVTELDFSFLKNDKKKLGVGDIAGRYERAFHSLAMKFQSLNSIERKYNAVLALVRSYVLKEFDGYDPEELSFFQEDRFLNLASNITIVKHALEEANGRPLIGNSFWLSAIETIGLGLASSKMYSVIEIGTIREFYTITSIDDVRDFKQGLIISRNLKENTSLKAYRSMEVGKDLTKLYEDKTVEAALNGIYTTLASLDSKAIHNFVHRSLQNVATPDNKYALYTMNTPANELEYMAIIFSKGLMISADVNNNFKFIYEIDISNSRIADELKTVFSVGLVTDPLVSLFYSSDFDGKRVIAVDNHPISDTKNVLFKNSNEVLTQSFGGKPIKFKFTAGNVSLSPSWSLAKLTGLVNLENIRGTTPLIGSILFEQLVEAYNHLTVYYNGLHQGKNSVADLTYAIENLNGSFLTLISPILKTKDIDHLMSSAIAQLWSGGELGSRFASSPLSEDRVKVELRIRLMVYVAMKLGFLSEEASVTRMIDALSTTKAFDRLIIA